ncbi:peptide-methionine (S)-S-oxide reductase [Candidatus Peregrinibacteria bacterium CG10_big_fil_rev_8_21_14_0_10_36_19]|nr:MAG: peptide-methionine (S)-S-oxide reductase [Candidatus Peregrinibacteria bacterium CG10_big_fil_rev_8_21_14_0_10_36_19]
MSQFDGYEKATFAGGCFWCIEPAFEELDGVVEAITGYAGGAEEDANYYAVVSGKTGHREAVEVFYDPQKVQYEDLLKVFWRQIDPTDAGGQFTDRGSGYKTAIYYHNESQRVLAQKSKDDLIMSGKFDKPIVTEVLPFSTFFPAEDDHQGYYKKRALHYQLYKAGSGREGFINENWYKN